MAEETKSKTGKKGREVYTHVKADARKEKRRVEADKRQARHDGLTLQEKIVKTIQRGGSVKERKKWVNALLVAEKEVKATVKVEAKAMPPKTVRTVKGEKRVSTYRKRVAKN